MPGIIYLPMDFAPCSSSENFATTKRNVTVSRCFSEKSVDTIGRLDEPGSADGIKPVVCVPLFSGEVAFILSPTDLSLTFLLLEAAFSEGG